MNAVNAAPWIETNRGDVPPGYCFIMAGWRECGRSKEGLVILERLR